MEASARFGRLWGIPLGVHWSWFLVFGLLTWSLAAGFFPVEYPGLSRPAHWLLAGITSLLFFGSVLLHELGHSIIALRNQVPVRAVTLFIFGGVAQIGREPRTAGAEFRIAIAGPLTSLGLGLLFAGLWRLDQPIAYLAAPSIWLARINLLLAGFNMIPGFPLDGGRVLRALIWQVTGSYRRATRVATISGQLVAVGFIGSGMLTILGGYWLNGLWLIFIGWFLQNAAASSYAQANLREMLGGVTVQQVMQPQCPLVAGTESLSDLVEERILSGGQRCFFVGEQDRLHGMLTLRDIAQVPRPQWKQVTARQVMRRWEDLVRVKPTTELLEALQAMDEANVAQVPVVEGEALVGVLSREHVLHYLRIRSELGI